MTTLAYHDILVALTEALQRRYGLNLISDRLEDATPVLNKLISKCRTNKHGKVTCDLQDSDQILTELVSRITIGETYFFRFPEQFDFIETAVIPQLLTQRAYGEKLKIWSAGCSSGEEAYSVAMLMTQMGLLAQSEIFATDISEESLAKARRASYGKWSLRDQGWERARRYLRSEGRIYSVRPDLRDAIKIQNHNLATCKEKAYEPPYVGMNLILCRNVLLYLKPQTVREVVEGLLASLRPGGYLITAPVDPVPTDLDADYLQIPDVGLVLRKSVHQDQSFVPAESASLPVSAATAGGSYKKIETKQILTSVAPVTQNRTPSTSGKRDKLTELLERGCEQEALELSREIIAEEPENMEVRYFEAMLLLAAKRYQSARECLRRLLYLDPMFGEAYFALGVTLMRLEDSSAAFKAFQQAETLRASDSSESSALVQKLHENSASQVPGEHNRTGCTIKMSERSESNGQ